MANSEIAKKIWDLFTVSRPALRKRYLTRDHKPDEILQFTPFKKEHTIKAASYYKQFEQILSSSDDETEGLLKVIDYFLELQEHENPDLLYYALQSFLVHHKGAVSYTIPSLIAREPELTIPSSSAGEAFVEIATGSPEETKMDWFREDPSLNEHHGHWHIVYNNGLLKNRQGEMFFYMHQQMIARYDADRLSSGVKRVTAFNKMSGQRIKAGYAPGEDVRLSNLIEAERFPNAKVRPPDANRQEQDLVNIMNDINGGYFKISHPQDPAAEIKVVNTVGATIEENLQSDTSRSYGNYHGNGHVYIGRLNNGVMLNTDTAVRDVIFWEWHKGVDDIYFHLQERFEPNDFSLHTPKINLRKQVLDNGNPYTPDIILCFTKDLPANPEQAGQALFAGAAWEKEFEEGSFTSGAVTIPTLKTLVTKMNKGKIFYRDANGDNISYEYPFLSHEPFSYFLRIENKEIAPQLLTIRIFIAPEETAEDRRSWIEMDKFISVVPGNTKKVIFRKDTQSSVIKKPAVADPSTYHLHFDPSDMPLDDRQCNCGWPYHLLVPKGKEEGMNFRLLVMVTDGEFDGLGKESDCGSISFCGSRSGDYPDKRPLGFPFNRKFNGNGKAITKLINSNPQFMCRTISIKHEP